MMPSRRPPVDGRPRLFFGIPRIDFAIVIWDTPKTRQKQKEGFLVKVVKMNTWHRRQAMMLAAQLPENLADAKLIIEAVEELLDTFLAKSPHRDGRDGEQHPTVRFW
jgi:hypothetical protein